jgi:tRNA(Ile)-lysidine synthase
VHKLAQCVLVYIRKRELLSPGDRLGIAVSGGADSVALLRLMLELRDEMGVVLSVVHLNHKLRGVDSEGDEQFVRDLAKAYGLEIIAEDRDVKSYAAERKLSLEAAAREARYEFFGHALTSVVNRLATAHTLDDQAETVLLKLTRGAGTRGLAGIYPKKAVNNAAVSHQLSAVSKGRPGLDEQEKTIIRPLLGSRRSQIREYLGEIGQTWREDASNQDLRHTRNRIRQEILPLLERQLNSAVCETLAESAEIARAEEAYWAKEVGGLLPKLWSVDERGGTLKLSSESLPLALRRRLLRAAAEHLDIALEFHHVEEILGTASGEAHFVLSDEWKVLRHGAVITFKKSTHTVSEYQYELPVPGKVTVVEAGIVLETAMAKGLTAPNGSDLVDLRLAKDIWVVRNWRPGERFWPAHTKEPKKIKELLQNRHITGEQKQRWPVIAYGDEILWVKGFGVRRDLQPAGRNGVLIRELRGSDK